MALPPDWKEFISLLNAHGVRYLVVGAHALAANGRPRATQDIDFWIEPSRANAERACAALVEFGLGELAAQVGHEGISHRDNELGTGPLSDVERQPLFRRGARRVDYELSSQSRSKGLEQGGCRFFFDASRHRRVPESNVS